MGAWRRLRRLDARYARWRYRHYDATPPLWLELGTLLGTAAAVTLGTAARSGGPWWLVAAVTGALSVAHLVAASRWIRRHRRPRYDEFEIAVDRE